MFGAQPGHFVKSNLSLSDTKVSKFSRSSTSLMSFNEIFSVQQILRELTLTDQIQGMLESLEVLPLLSQRAFQNLRLRLFSLKKKNLKLSSSHCKLGHL